MIHPLFTVDMLQRLYVFFSILDFIKALRSIYQNVQYFIRSKNRLNLNLLQLDILCTSAVKRNYTKLQFTVYVSPVFQRIRVRGSKKNLPSSSSYLNLVSSLLWRALQQKMYRQDSRDTDHLKHVLLHCWIQVIRIQ